MTQAKSLRPSEAAVVRRIAQVAAGAGTRPAKARTIAAMVRSEGGYRWAGVYEVGEEEIRALGWDGPDAPVHPSFPRSMGLCGAAAASRAVVRVDDVRDDPRYLTTLSTTRSEIIVPAVRAGGKEVAGLLDVSSERVAGFSDADQAFLEACAVALAGLWG
jgi:putative methionine-R-sulfoxide reductase with GAF domain